MAEELEQTDIKCQILHLGVEKSLNPQFSLADYVLQTGASVAAFSLHWHQQTFDTIEAAHQLKDAVPSVTIVFGGYTATYFAREILREFPWVDAVIRGEGEESLAKLTRKIKENGSDFREIPNLTWREKGDKIIENQITSVPTSIELNQWDFTSLQLIRNWEEYVRLKWVFSWEKEICFIHRHNRRIKEPTFYGVPVGRGCTGSCTWCGGSYQNVKQSTGRCRISRRRPENIAESIKKLSNRYNIQRFYFCYDPEPHNEIDTYQLFEAIGQLRPKVKIDFEYFGLPTKELIRSFHRNLHYDSTIILSPETASETLRKTHRSYFFTNNQMEETLCYLDNMRIKTKLYFLFGLPGERIDDIHATNQYRKYLKRKFDCIQRIYVYPVEMEPGAPWFEDPHRFKIISHRKTIHDFYLAHAHAKLSLGYETEHFTEQELIQNYYRLFYPARMPFLIFVHTLRRLLKICLIGKRSPRRKWLRRHGSMRESPNPEPKIF